MERFERIRRIIDVGPVKVYVVKRIEDNKVFVLKSIRLDTENEKIRDPQNEVMVMQELKHPNIITYYETFIHNSKLCILMEYAENGDLKDQLSAAYSKGDLIPEEQIVEWLAQICLALKYLHDNNIIHRDLKVQNIFRNKSGLIKLGDFGISKKLDNEKELAQTSLGTPYYLSPEICKNQSYNNKIDIWMLGCTLFELCSNHKPFSGTGIHDIALKIVNEEPEEFPKNYSLWIKNLVGKMLQKDPDRRPDINDIIQIPQIFAQYSKLKEKYAEYEGFIMPVQKKSLSLQNFKEGPQFMENQTGITTMMTPIQQQQTFANHNANNYSNNGKQEDDVSINSQNNTGSKDFQQTPKSCLSVKSPNTNKKTHAPNSIVSLIEKARKNSPMNSNQDQYQKLSSQQSNKRKTPFNEGSVTNNEETFGLISTEELKKTPSQNIQNLNTNQVSYPYSPFQQHSFTPTTQITSNLIPKSNQQKSFTPNAAQKKQPAQNSILPPQNITMNLANQPLSQKATHHFNMILPLQTNNLQLKQSQNLEFNLDNSPFLNSNSSYTPTTSYYQQNKLLLNDDSFQQSERGDYSKNSKLKNKLYYKPRISINTAALESNYCNKKSTPGSQKSIPENDSQMNDKNIPTQKVNCKKTFNFDDQLFSQQKAPQSPQRTILSNEFLRKKLGDEKFLKMKTLLESSSNPMKILEENQDQVCKIIGEENMECIKIYKFLITSSVTPPNNNHFRTRSTQYIEEQLNNQAILLEQQQQQLSQPEKQMPQIPQVIQISLIDK